jgi:hypothetical protein
MKIKKNNISPCILCGEEGKLKITHNKDINEYEISILCIGKMCRREVYSIGHELSMDVFRLVIERWNGIYLKEE